MLVLICLFFCILMDSHWTLQIRNVLTYWFCVCLIFFCRFLSWDLHLKMKARWKWKLKACFYWKVSWVFAFSQLNCPFILFFFRGRFGALFSLCCSTAIFCCYHRGSTHTLSILWFLPTLFFSPTLLALPPRLSVAQLVCPFCLFSLSHPLFSRDALKLLVFLLLSASLSIWANCFGRCIQVGVSYFFFLLPRSHLPACPSPSSLHLFI